MPYQISPLAEVISSIPVLAEWHHREWQHLNSDSYDLEARIHDYRQTALSAHLPVMYVAHLNDNPLGSARLVKNDMQTHPELSPWLASLYVHEQYRRQGIATALIKSIESAALERQFRTLYLFTENQQPLYKNLAWQVISEETYFNEKVTIMEKKL